MFGKLRVWDTEHNNGVLIYLLLAEHAIEIVADRGLSRHVRSGQWRRSSSAWARPFTTGRFEDGLTQALEEVVGAACRAISRWRRAQANPNELPDQPRRWADGPTNKTPAFARGGLRCGCPQARRGPLAVVDH